LLSTPISAEARSEELGDLVRMSWASCRRRKAMIAAVTFVAIGIAGLYLVWRGQAYTASARILVDNRVLALAQQDAIYSISSLTSQLMQSQVEILRAENIARRVIDQLGLLHARDFGADADKPAGAAPADAAPAADTPAPDPRALRLALNRFQKRLAVEQVGQSYVIEVRMTASDPQAAADITNSLVTAYLDDQAAANANAAQSASGWLRDRMRALGTSARVLSAATAPIDRDGPRGLVILAFAAFCGLTMGAGLAFSRDLLDRRLRSREAVQSVAQVECFGVLPAIQRRGSLFGGWRGKAKPAPADGTLPLVAEDASLDWASERPRSMFAHGLRRARAALFAGRPNGFLTVGVTSSLPREGKTVVAANLARLIAHWKRRVLLVDAAPYNGQLTRLLAPQAKQGLADLLTGARFEDLVLCDRWSAMHFLPNPVEERGPPLDVTVIAAALERSLPHIRSQYDLVVIDLPPLVPVSDAQELAHLIDKVLLVVEWGRCKDDELAAALAGSGIVRSKLIGAVLNKANPQVLQRYADDPDFIGSAEFADYVSDKERRAPVAPPTVAEEEPRHAAAASAAARGGNGPGGLLRPIGKMKFETRSLEEGSKGNA
jgi:Mrp family chromosome partitioning ATPase/capsular polysaccharide biosynthesis protein